MPGLKPKKKRTLILIKKKLIGKKEVDEKIERVLNWNSLIKSKKWLQSRVA